jgi:hypothetical protein
MKEITSVVDITLKIPPLFKNFPNENEIVEVFVANTPKDVEDYIAEYYTEHKPNVFSYTQPGMNNRFGSTLINVSATPVQVPTHALQTWFQIMNESDEPVYIGGKDVTVGNGWSKLEASDTTEKYYELSRDSWMVSANPVDVKVLWGISTESGNREKRTYIGYRNA